MLQDFAELGLPPPSKKKVHLNNTEAWPARAESVWLYWAGLLVEEVQVCTVVH